MGIADEKYVSITTYRRSGEAVSSPVWIAPLGDGTAGFTTGLNSGKVKRIGNNPKVTLRPCTMRGKVADGAAEVQATARVLTTEEMPAIRRAIGAKYGIIAKVMNLSEKLASFVRRSKPSPNGVIHLRFD